MRFPTREQTSAAANVVHAAAGNITTTILAAPGANKRYRLFAWEVALDEASAIRVKLNLRRPGSTLIARAALGGNQPSDHVSFGEGGFLMGGNQAVDMVSAAAAATNFDYVIRYAIEGV